MSKDWQNASQQTGNGAKNKDSSETGKELKKADAQRGADTIEWFPQALYSDITPRTLNWSKKQVVVKQSLDLPSQKVIKYTKNSDNNATQRAVLFGCGHSLCVRHRRWVWRC